MQISPARRAAFEILRRVEEGGYSSGLLAATDNDLSAQDRALCHELVLGVLRWRLWLDRGIEHFAGRKIEQLDLAVTLVLRLGIYQLRFLTRIPASAAVNEAVKLIRAARVKSAATFVNAVLRRATREPDYDPAAGVADHVEKLAIQTSHPRWLIERWFAQFGEEETAALARANNEVAPLAFRFTKKALSQDEAPGILRELQDADDALTPSLIAPESWRIPPNKAAGSTTALLRRLSREGLIYFQDEASQLVARLLNAGSGDSVLDVCAAPGSKSTLIAALAPQAAIVAGDLREHRVQIINELAARQGIVNVALVVHDATQGLPFSDSSFDRVLVDAPCSGTGTLRQNPEIRWRLQPEDVAELAAKQKLILHNASAMVRPGGLLLYSTCSVEVDENEAVVSDFLDSRREFSRATLEAPPGVLTHNGEVRTWPQRDGVDGFFASALRRGDR